MHPLLDHAIRARYAALAVACGLIWLATYSRDDDADWHFFVDGAHHLTGSGGLHVFADMPFLQFGPIALLLGVAFDGVGPNHGWALVSALDMALGLVAIRFLECAAVHLRRDAQPVGLAVLIGGPFVLAAWASPGVSQGHPDDVLALLAIAAAIWAVTAERWLVAAVLVGSASAAKPWALLCLPLAAALEGRRVRGLVIAGVAATIPWLPFLIAAPSTTRVGRFHLGVEPTSTLHYLGLSVGSHPAWPRYAQLAVALALCAVAVRRGMWVLVPLIAFAVRINLDPATIDYYAAGPVLGAFVWDLASNWQIPGLRTFLVWGALLYLPSSVHTLGAGGPAFDVTVVALRVAVLAVAVWTAVRSNAEPNNMGHSRGVLWPKTLGSTD